MSYESDDILNFKTILINNHYCFNTVLSSITTGISILEELISLLKIYFINFRFLSSHIPAALRLSLA
jgi:hypothetical protein